jgi:GTPase SAR1 family protein
MAWFALGAVWGWIANDHNVTVKDKKPQIEGWLNEIIRERVENLKPVIMIIGPPKVGKTTLLNFLTNRLKFSKKPMTRMDFEMSEGVMWQTEVEENPGSSDGNKHGSFEVKRIVTDDFIIYDTPGLETRKLSFDDEKIRDIIDKCDVIIYCISNEHRFDDNHDIFKNVKKDTHVVYAMTKINKFIASEGRNYMKAFNKLIIPLGFNSQNEIPMELNESNKHYISLEFLSSPVDILDDESGVRNNKKLFWPDECEDNFRRNIMLGVYGQNMRDWILKQCKVELGGILIDDLYIVIAGNRYRFTTFYKDGFLPLNKDDLKRLVDGTIKKLVVEK